MSDLQAPTPHDAGRAGGDPGIAGADPSIAGADPSIATEEIPEPTAEDVLDALSNVIDPELGLDFVELGLVYGVEVSEGHVEITFTLTTPACPIGPHVTEQMEEFVGEVEGVKSVDCQMVFSPPWSPERMSEDAKFALGY